MLQECLGQNPLQSAKYNAAASLLASRQIPRSDLTCLAFKDNRQPLSHLSTLFPPHPASYMLSPFSLFYPARKLESRCENAPWAMCCLVGS